MKIPRDSSHDDILIIEKDEKEKESMEDKIKRKSGYGSDRMKDTRD